MAATQSWFWFFAGLLSGTVAALVLRPVWQSLTAKIANPLLRGGVTAMAAVVLGAGIVFLYRQVGRPDALGAATASAPHESAKTSNGGKVGSVEEEAVALADRLNRNGGSRDDWMLLAQSYDFLGRPDAAAEARARAEKANGAGNGSMAAAQPAAAPLAATDAKSLEARVAKDPRDAAAWLELAALKRQQRDFAGARVAFKRVIALRAMTADAWADYADALGSLSQGSLKGEPARAIESALALDPNHPKALWLKASLAHDEHRYTDALRTWRQLRAALPADSPDIAAIDGNIAESAQLAGLPLPPATPVAAPAPAAEVAGTVSLDSRFASRVAPGVTLFIYAKAADSPGPPLAVLRTTAAQWPVAFRLDDSMAMIPSRRLSGFDRIVVEARLSKSGQATPSSGDLYVVSPVVRPADAKSLKLVISQEVG